MVSWAKVVGGLVFAAVAQASRLHFHSGSIDTETDPQFDQVRTFSTSALNDPRKESFLVHFAAEATPEAVQELETALGQKLDTVLHNNFFLLYGTYATALRAKQSPLVAWVGTFQPQLKLHANVEELRQLSERHERTRRLMIRAASNESFQFSRMSRKSNLPVEDVYPNRLLLTLATTFSDEELEVKFAEWSDALDAKFGHSVALYKYRPDGSLVSVSLESTRALEDAIQWFAEQGEVIEVARRENMFLRNKWARGLTQDGNPNPDYSDKFGSAVTSGGIMSYKYDLLGQGEIVGVADSGLAWQGCMFTDPKVPTVTATLGGSASRPRTPERIVSLHRKIVQYIFNSDSDSVDDNGGHGTHVAGSIAGKAQVDGKMSEFNGMAPEAKLAFFDIGKTGTDYLGGIPNNVDLSLFPWAYLAGARIHSNSWGGSTTSYDQGAREMDNFMWDNKDFMVTVAAGNDGDNGYSSVGTPATFKNGISVGAGVNSQNMFSEWPGGSGFGTFSGNAKPGYHSDLADFSSIGPVTPAVDKRHGVTLVAIGANIVSANVGTQNSCASPLDRALQKMPGTSMATPVLAGNLAIVRQYLREGWYPGGARPSDISKGFNPSGALLKAILINGATALTGSFGGEKLGRQSLSAAQADAGKGTIPNVAQGFGRIELRNSLYFIGSKRKLIIYRGPKFSGSLSGYYVNSPVATDSADKFFGDPYIETTSQSFTFCVVGKEFDVKVSLVWIDKPKKTSTDKQLQTDLNLKVTHGISVYLGNGGTTADSLNTAEQVVIKSASLSIDEDYTITVERVSSTPSFPQPFALVVTGNVLEGSCASSTASETFAWVTGPYSTCSKSCDKGTQTRTVTCVSSKDGPLSDTDLRVTDGSCQKAGGNKPTNTQFCNEKACSIMTFEWTLGTWGVCSKSCDGGQRKRTVTCMNIPEPGSVASSLAVDEKYCEDHAKPPLESACNTDACNSGNVGDVTSFHWELSKWGECVGTDGKTVVCGGGIRNRTVICKIGDYKTIDQTLCARYETKPPEREPCNTCTCNVNKDPCGTAGGGAGSNTWLTSSWGECSAGCGGGTQVRAVRCRSSNGYFETDDACDAASRPPGTNECNFDACVIDDLTKGSLALSSSNFEWLVAQWGTCDPLTKVQTRWVVCRKTTGEYGSIAKCEAHVGEMPVKSQPCTPAATPTASKVEYVYKWFADRWGDCQKWCGGGANAIATRVPACSAQDGFVPKFSSACRDPKPQVEKACGQEPCGSSATWYAGEWMGCTNNAEPCLGSEHRHRFCIDTSGKKLDDLSVCTSIKAPEVDLTQAPCSCCSQGCMYVPGASNGISDGTKPGDRVPYRPRLSAASGTPASLLVVFVLAALSWAVNPAA